MVGMSGPNGATRGGCRSLTPSPPRVDIDSGDKLGHLAAYALVMFWFARLHARRLPYAVGFVAMGVGLELAQAWLGYRSIDTAAIYGDWPPLVNVARKPGEWQTYDIVFEAPRFNSNGSLLSPAYATVFWNGVIVHNRQRIAGPTSPTQTVHQYDKPHEAELPLTLQDHSNPVRFRNIWVRRLKGYDQN